MMKNPADASHVRFVHLSKGEAILWLTTKSVWKSGIGHQDTANIVSNDLKTDIPFNRVTLQLERGDVVLVTQYMGARLPEGCTVLPEGSKFEYFLAIVE